LIKNLVPVVTKQPGLTPNQELLKTTTFLTDQIQLLQKKKSQVLEIAIKSKISFNKLEQELQPEEPEVSWV
jgi:hypothetical protein